jgi:hypothetical protein
VQRRVQGRIPLPSFDFSPKVLAYHQAEGMPLLRFEDIPLDLTDLRLIVRQSADILRRFGALDEEEFQKAQSIGRDLELVARIGGWYRATAERRAGASVGTGPGSIAHSAAGVGVSDSESSTMDQLFTVAMRPFLSPGRHHAGSRAPSHLRPLQPALEFRTADVPVLPQQRPVAYHVLRHAGRPVSGLCVRCLLAVFEDVRWPAHETSRDAGCGQHRHDAARCGGDAKRLYELVCGCFDRRPEQVLRPAR